MMNNFNNFGFPVEKNNIYTNQVGNTNQSIFGNSGYMAPTKPMDYDEFFGNKTKKPNFLDKAKAFFSQHGSKILGWGTTIFLGTGILALGKKFIDMDVPYGKGQPKPSEDATFMEKFKYNVCTFLSDTAGIMKKYEKPTKDADSVAPAAPSTTPAAPASSAAPTPESKPAPAPGASGAPSAAPASGAPAAPESAPSAAPAAEPVPSGAVPASSAEPAAPTPGAGAESKPEPATGSAGFWSKLKAKAQHLISSFTPTNGVSSTKPETKPTPSNVPPKVVPTSYQVEGKGKPMNSEEVYRIFHSKTKEEPIFINDQGKNNGLYVPTQSINLLKRTYQSKIPRFNYNGKTYAKLDEKVFELKESNVKALKKLLSNKHVVQALLKQTNADNYNSSIIGKLATNLLHKLTRQTAETQSDGISKSSSLELFNILKHTISTITNTKDYALLGETNNILDGINTSQNPTNPYPNELVSNVILKATKESYQKLSQYVVNKVSYNETIYLNHKGEQVQKNDKNAIFEVSNNNGIIYINNKLRNQTYDTNTNSCSASENNKNIVETAYYINALQQDLQDNMAASSAIDFIQKNNKEINHLIETLSEIEDFNFEVLIDSIAESDFTTSEENEAALELMNVLVHNDIPIDKDKYNSHTATFMFKKELYSKDFDLTKTILKIKQQLNIDDSQLASIIASCDLKNLDFDEIKEQISSLSYDYDDYNTVLDVLDNKEIDLDKSIGKNKISDLVYYIMTIQKLSTPIKELKDLTTQEINYIITSTPEELKKTQKYEDFCRNVNTVYINHITQTSDTNQQVNSMLEFAGLFINDTKQIDNFVNKLNSSNHFDFDFSTEVIKNLCQTATSTMEPENSVNARFLLTSILNNNEINLDKENKKKIQEALITNFTDNVIANISRNFSDDESYTNMGKEIIKFIQTPIFTDNENSNSNFNKLILNLYKSGYINFSKLLEKISNANIDNKDQMIKLIYTITRPLCNKKEEDDKLLFRKAFNSLMKAITSSVQDCFDYDDQTKEEEQIVTINKYFNYIIENNHDLDDDDTISYEEKMSSMCQSIIPSLLEKNIITQDFIDTLMNNVLQSNIEDEGQPNLNMSLLQAISNNTEISEEVNKMAEVALKVIEISDTMQTAVSKEEELVGSINYLNDKIDIDTTAKIFDKIEMSNLNFDELSNLITSQEDNVEDLIDLFEHMEQNKQVGNSTVSELVDNLYNKYIDSLMNKALDNDDMALSTLQNIFDFSTSDNIKEMAEVALKVIEISNAMQTAVFQEEELVSSINKLANELTSIDTAAKIFDKIDMKDLNFADLSNLITLQEDNVEEFIYLFEHMDQKKQVGDKTVGELVNDIKNNSPLYLAKNLNDTNIEKFITALDTLEESDKQNLQNLFKPVTDDSDIDGQNTLYSNLVTQLSNHITKQKPENICQKTIDILNKLNTHIFTDEKEQIYFKNSLIISIAQDLEDNKINQIALKNLNKIIKDNDEKQKDIALQILHEMATSDTASNEEKPLDIMPGPIETTTASSILSEYYNEELQNAIANNQIEAFIKTYNSIPEEIMIKLRFNDIEIPEDKIKDLPLNNLSQLATCLLITNEENIKSINNEIINKLTSTNPTEAREFINKIDINNKQLISLLKTNIQPINTYNHSVALAAMAKIEAYTILHNNKNKFDFSKLNLNEQVTIATNMFNDFNSIKSLNIFDELSQVDFVENLQPQNASHMILLHQIKTNSDDLKEDAEKKYTEGINQAFQYFESLNTKTLNIEVLMNNLNILYFNGTKQEPQNQDMFNNAIINLNTAINKLGTSLDSKCRETVTQLVNTISKDNGMHNALKEALNASDGGYLKTLLDVKENLKPDNLKNLLQYYKIESSNNYAGYLELIKELQYLGIDKKTVLVNLYKDTNNKKKVPNLVKNIKKISKFNSTTKENLENDKKDYQNIKNNIKQADNNTTFQTILTNLKINKKMNAFCSIITQTNIFYNRKYDAKNLISFTNKEAIIDLLDKYIQILDVAIILKETEKTED